MNPPGGHVTISFDTQGGSAISSVSIVAGNLLLQPSNPSLTGYTFQGWYTDSTFETPWNFNDPVTRNMTLVAKWEIEHHLVSFVSNGGNHVPSEPADYGTLVACPPDPIRPGYVFDGWFADTTISHPWDFAVDLVMTDLTLHAMWHAVPMYVAAVSTGYDSIQVSWSQSGVSDVEVWRATSATGPWVKIGTDATHLYADSSLAFNGTYFYKMLPYAVIGTETIYGDFSSVTSATTALMVPSVQVKSTSFKTIDVSWTAVPSASNYEVSRAASPTGPFTILTTGTTALLYADANLTTGTNYYYRVRAYRLVGTLKVFGAYSSLASVAPVLDAPSNPYAAKANATSIKVSWTSASGATGVEVWRATSPTGTFTLLGTSTTSSYTNKGTLAGTTYYYRVRSYKTFSKTSVVYSSWSEIVWAST